MSLFRRSATTIRTNAENTAKRRKVDQLAPIVFGRIQTTLGKSKTRGIKILLDTGSSQSHVKRDFVTKLRHEVDRLCQIGVLKKVNRSEWAAPTFIIPKKDGSVRFISDFRELNKRIVH